MKELAAGRAGDGGRGQRRAPGHRLLQHALISARLFTRRPDAEIDTSFFVRSAERALALRDWLFDAPFYRLAHAEADGLPGLVVDRFGSALVVQLNTAGLEARRDAVLEALDDVLSPETVILRNDSPAAGPGRPGQHGGGGARRRPSAGSARKRGRRSRDAPAAGRRPAGSSTSATTAPSSRAGARRAFWMFPAMGRLRRPGGGRRRDGGAGVDRSEAALELAERRPAKRRRRGAAPLPAAMPSRRCSAWPGRDGLGHRRGRPAQFREIGKGPACGSARISQDGAAGGAAGGAGRDPVRRLLRTMSPSTRSPSRWRRGLGDAGRAGRILRSRGRRAGPSGPSQPAGNRLSQGAGPLD